MATRLFDSLGNGLVDSNGNPLSSMSWPSNQTIRFGAVTPRGNGRYDPRFPRGDGTPGNASGAGIVVTSSGPGGSASGGGISGGTSSLAWSMPNGFSYRNPIHLTSPNASKHFGSMGGYRKFEDFRNASIGSSLTTSNSIFDDFGTAPVVMSDNTGTGKSIRIWDGSYVSGGQTGRPLQGVLHLPQCVELMISCSVNIPTGTYFPGATSANTFPGLSCWKMFWAFIEDLNDNFGNGFGPNGNGTGNPGPTPTRTAQGNDNDFIPCNWAGGPGFQADGNDISNLVNLGSYPVDPQSKWRFGTRNRLTMWVRADPTNPTTAAGQYFFQIANSTGVYELLLNPVPVASYDPAVRPIFSGTVGTRHWWEWLNIVGWMGNFSANNSVCDPRYSQIVVAADATASCGARAKVEVGNNPVYANCSKLTDLDVWAWSDTDVWADLTWDDLDPAQPMYLFQTLPSITTVRNAFGQIH